MQWFGTYKPLLILVQESVLMFGFSANCTTAYNESYHKKAIKRHTKNIHYRTMLQQLSKRIHQGMLLDDIPQQTGSHAEVLRD